MLTLVACGDDPKEIEEIIDFDGDGFNQEEDCDDNNASVYFGASEVCDEVDNDCDGDVDEEVQTTYYADGDNDGFGDVESTIDACELPEGFVEDNSDCNDSANDVNPSATEVCDEIDNNCDDVIDEDVQITFYADSDADGFGDELRGHKE